MQVVCEHLGWDYNNCSKGIAMYGGCKTFMRDDEEQWRGMLHGDCLVWQEGFDEIGDAIFDPYSQKHQAARERLEEFINR